MIYPIVPLCVLALPALRRLPNVVLFILLCYALTQQVAALLAPEPILASALALVRSLLIGGLVGIGVLVQRAALLKPLGAGLLIVYLSAALYGAANGFNFLTGRLSHPYMTAIALGLSGVFGIWLALFASGRWWWRLPLGVAGLVILLLSGSRGPLLATFIGCLVGFGIRRGIQAAMGALFGSLLLLSGVYVGDRLGISAVTRLVSSDTTGRDVVWYDTLSVIHSYRLAGVGSYRLGKYLTSPSNPCSLFLGPDGVPLHCPAWLAHLDNPWLIAHNLTLQQWAETGPLGLAGFFILLGLIGYATLQGQNPLAGAIISGMLVSTITDNTILVPNPFFAEVFWIVAGMQLLNLKRLQWSVGAFTVGLALVLSLPLFLGLRSSTVPIGPSKYALNLFVAPTEVQSTQAYTTYAQFQIPAGSYRADLESCARFCTSLLSTAFTVSGNRSPLLTLTSDLLPMKTQNLQLRLLPGSSSFSVVALASRNWTVKVKP
ncbi:O-antigen ligase family protein [Deinococcus ruber]|uniref:O-antigen ligase family protein n=1 Tax=Deinococcus ruber TaxID=1848197 RepID=UPI00166379A3|nr:O-antigen ligase family protein [Deinococcus ruber]